MNRYLTNVTRSLRIAILGVLTLQSAHATVTLAVSRDEMSSGFLFGSPSLRGGGEASSRNLNAVSAPLPFGVRGERTYLSFSTFTPSSFSGPIAQATLRLETLERGFGLAPPSEDEPFQVSIHALSQGPREIDAMATEGEQSLGYFEENHYGEVIATQALNGFGIAEWDLTSLVNAWISEANTVFALAITGSDAVNGDHAIGIYNSTWAVLDGQQVPEIVIEEDVLVFPYEQWKQSTLGGVEGDDPDADGRSNLLEYALGSDPLQYDSNAVLIYRSGAWLISDEMDTPPPTDTVVDVQYSLTLSSADWETIASRQTGTDWAHADVEDRLQARMTGKRAGFARIVVDLLNP